MESRLFGGRGHGLGRFEFPERASGQRDAVRVMDEAIEDGVAKRGVADEFVPVVHGHLAGYESRAPTGSIFDHFEEIAAFAIAERGEPPVIQDEQVGLGELLQEPSVRSITARNRQLAEESRQTDVADHVPLAARTVAERTGQPGLPRSSGTDHENHVMVPDPVAGTEPEEDVPVEAALHAEVHVLQTGGLAKACDLEQPRESPIVAAEALPFKEEREAVFKSETREIRHTLLFFERLGHSGEPQRVQEVERLLHQHERSPDVEEEEEEEEEEDKEAEDDRGSSSADSGAGESA